MGNMIKRIPILDSLLDGLGAVYDNIFPSEDCSKEYKYSLSQFSKYRHLEVEGKCVTEICLKENGEWLKYYDIKDEIKNDTNMYTKHLPMYRFLPEELPWEK